METKAPAKVIIFIWDMSINFLQSSSWGYTLTWYFYDEMLVHSAQQACQSKIRAKQIFGKPRPQLLLCDSEVEHALLLLQFVTVVFFMFINLMLLTY